ncbi:MAG: HAD-IIIA family hydrolase [Candidatus Hydrothermales bacterium]
MRRNLLFLDRDGVLIEDRDYGELGDPFRLKIRPGVIEGLEKLKKLNFHFFVFSNQAGINKGYYKISDVIKNNERIDQFLETKGLKVLKYYFCPHLPSELCSCRKPNLSLYRQWTKDFPFDYEHRFMIGDKDSDIEFGKRLNMITIYLKTRYPLTSKPDFVVHNFEEAINYICSYFF